MKKINFNDRYGLTQAVIEGRKTMTRRIELRGSEQNIVIPGGFEATSRCLKVRKNGQLIMSVPFRYKLGEIVAVAQSYDQINPYIIHYRTDETGDLIGDHPGQRNKMFVSADEMPRQIRITGIKCERLQDISDMDCIREGIMESIYSLKNKYYFVCIENGSVSHFSTPREAFAALIDKVSGRGTWERNPWVTAYEFELVK